MKAAPALAILCLVLVPLLDAAAAPPEKGGAASLAAAQKTLETARANLATAVQLIEKDPPNTADLDAAHAAVGALKDAIDSGAEHEGKDLDYAKAVLGARKELRTHRELVDQRRAKVHIFNARRSIDALVTTLNERAKDIEGKETSAKDFEEARGAIAAVKKAAEEGKQFAKQDEKFATYLTEVEATLARQQKAIDDRWVVQSADQHRSLVDESRQVLTAAVAGLSKASTDAQFETGDRAASVLSKLLEEGKPLEAKDKTYRASAESSRKELAQAKKKMGELFAETGLERLKAEIEPAHKDLIAAGKAVRARKPTAEQLAEAKTAGIVVRKLIEKFQPQAARSPPFGQYVAEVNKTLVEVEVELQKRTLDSARAELNQALKNVNGRAATDEHFAEAATAATILEKTLETVHTRDPALAPTVGDIKLLLKDAKAVLAKRRVEVDVQRQKTKVEEARKVAADLSRQNLGKDKLPEAEAAVVQLETVLEEGAALIKKDREYAAYDKEIKVRIKELTERNAARKVALAAGDFRAVLTEAVTALKARIEEAKQPEATDAQIEAGVKAVEALSKAVEAQTPMEKQDKAYAAHAERVRNDFMRLSDLIELARLSRELRKLTSEVLAAGAAAAELAAAAQNLRAQKDHHEKAVAQFKACQSGGNSMLRDYPILEKSVVLLEGRRTNPKEVIALCVQRAQASEKLLAQVLPLIAFDEGPKRAFEAAKHLLSQSKQGDAAKQYDECISSGMILQNRSPEIKERTFEVAGGGMTLGEVIQQCISQRKALKGK